MLQLLYLRRFKNLRTLNLGGNPFCENADPPYKAYVAAFLPHLEYLDYRLIDEDTVRKLSNNEISS